MTDYNDVPQVNTLHQENERVNQAIEMIDGGGPLTQFTISPPPALAPAPGAPMPMMQMAVMITVPGPPDEALMGALRTWLTNRSAAIEKELAGLGVTDTPPSKAQQKPATPAQPAQPTSPQRK